MFRSISIPRATQHGPGPMIDPGSLAEALIFYGTVHVVGHHASIRDLLRTLGANVLTELVQDEFLSIVYAPVMHAIATQNAGNPSEVHGLVNVERAQSDIERVLPELIAEHIGRPGRARRLASRIIRRAQTYRPDPAILESARADVRNTELTRQVARDVLMDAVPSYRVPDDLRFDVHDNNGLLRIDTNIDFVRANAIYHQAIPVEHSSLTPAYILGMVTTTHENVAVATVNQSELLASSLHAALIQYRLASALTRSQRAADQRHRFQEFVFRDARAIGDAVRDGQVSFEDVLDVLRKKQKWKEWLHSQPEDANLLHEYYDALVRETWLEKLPAKSTRWSVFVGLGIAVDLMGTGLIGTAGGVALSALDATIVEGLMRGWRPHQFLEGPLRRLVEKSVELPRNPKPRARAQVVGGTRR